MLWVTWTVTAIPRFRGRSVPSTSGVEGFATLAYQFSPGKASKCRHILEGAQPLSHHIPPHPPDPTFEAATRSLRRGSRGGARIRVLFDREICSLCGRLQCGLETSLDTVACVIELVRGIEGVGWQWGVWGVGDDRDHVSCSLWDEGAGNSCYVDSAVASLGRGIHGAESMRVAVDWCRCCGDSVSAGFRRVELDVVLIFALFAAVCGPTGMSWRSEEYMLKDMHRFYSTVMRMCRTI